MLIELIHIKNKSYIQFNITSIQSIGELIEFLLRQLFKSFLANAPVLFLLKPKETFSFLVFSWGIRWEDWSEMNYSGNHRILLV